jgi:hypothetical protein
MWNQTFVLADKIKLTLLAWTIILIVAATVADQLTISQTTTIPLAILGLFAQACIVMAALNVGDDGDVRSSARSLVGRVFGVSFVSGLAILLGTVMLIIPGVFLLVRWWIAVPIALDRNLGVSDALRESWQLTAPHWASILGIALTLLAMFALSMTGLGLIGGLGDERTSLPLSLAMNSVLYSITSLSTVTTVAVYWTIYQPMAQLRQVFE